MGRRCGMASSSSSDCDSDWLNYADTTEQSASESTSQECAAQGKEEANNGSKDRFLAMKLQQIGKQTHSQPNSSASCSSTDSKDKLAKKSRKARKKTAAHRNTKSDDR